MLTLIQNFYPRSPCGERRRHSINCMTHTHFYPRSPCGERHPRFFGTEQHIYFYPRSPCGERLVGVAQGADTRDISIHALLAESDYKCPIICTMQLIISIHALLAESDHPIGVLITVIEISIHALLAESDRLESIYSTARFYFYPRSPCGERQGTLNLWDAHRVFLSTLSLRRATRRSVKLFRQNYISIHALLAESDMLTGILPHHGRDFYPRSPCGERPSVLESCSVCSSFLSTLSLRRAT